VVENFRADVKARLGIDYDSLRKINPPIVYGSISGRSCSHMAFPETKFVRLGSSVVLASSAQSPGPSLA
jgi:crotonobetainyl-CoA:carnitine CoA-transferase CaiB-like acyl-CoA transferase